MFKLHSICFTNKMSFFSWIGECLMVIDASIAVVTLGVVEVNFSCLWYAVIDEIYPKALTGDNRDKW